jgi:mRNA interferase MazF
VAARLPNAGDIRWVELDPIMGTEQAGRRPALVVSSLEYHRVSPRALVCPISRNDAPWPFNVALPDDLKTQGAVLVDQARSIDRASRLHRHIERVPDGILEAVREILRALVNGR